MLLKVISTPPTYFPEFTESHLLTSEGYENKNIQSCSSFESSFFSAPFSYEHQQLKSQSLNILPPNNHSRVTINISNQALSDTIKNTREGLQQSGARYLFADDNQFIRTIFEKSIEPQMRQNFGKNLQYHIAKDGKLGFSAVKHNIAALKLVITDFDMPTQDGLALALQLRQSHYTGLIIFQTSLTDNTIFYNCSSPWIMTDKITPTILKSLGLLISQDTNSNHPL